MIPTPTVVPEFRSSPERVRIYTKLNRSVQVLGSATKDLADLDFRKDGERWEDPTICKKIEACGTPSRFTALGACHLDVNSET
jgi:hypothetical protein